MKKFVWLLSFWLLIFAPTVLASGEKISGPYLVPAGTNIDNSVFYHGVFAEKNNQGYLNYLGKEIGHFPVACPENAYYDDKIITQEKYQKNGCLIINQDTLNQIKTVKGDVYLAITNLGTKTIGVYKNNKLIYSYSLENNIEEELGISRFVKFSVNEAGDWLLAFTNINDNIIIFNGKKMITESVGVNDKYLLSYDIDAEKLTFSINNKFYKIVDGGAVAMADPYAISKKTIAGKTVQESSFGKLKLIVESVDIKNCRENRDYERCNSYKVYFADKLIGTFLNFDLKNIYTEDYDVKKNIVDLKQVVASFEKDKKFYIYNKGVIMGPYEELDYLHVNDKNILFSYCEKNKRHVWLNNKELGVYNDCLVKKNEDDYRSFMDTFVNLSELQGDKWFYTYKKLDKDNNEIGYFNVNGKVFTSPIIYGGKAYLDQEFLYIFNEDEYSGVYRDGQLIHNCRYSSVFDEKINGKLVYKCRVKWMEYTEKSLLYWGDQLIRQSDEGKGDFPKYLITKDAIIITEAEEIKAEDYISQDPKRSYSSREDLGDSSLETNEDVPVPINQEQEPSYKLTLTEIPVSSLKTTVKKTNVNVSDKNLMLKFNFGQKFTTKFQGHQVGYEKIQSLDWFTIDGKKYGPYDYIITDSVDWNSKGWLFAASYKGSISLIANGKVVLSLNPTTYDELKYSVLSSSGQPVYAYTVNGKLTYVNAKGKKFPYENNCYFADYKPERGQGMVICWLGTDGYRINIIGDDNKVTTQKYPNVVVAKDYVPTLNSWGDVNEPDSQFAYSISSKSMSYLLSTILDYGDYFDHVIYHNTKEIKRFTGHLISFGFIGDDKPYLVYTLGKVDGSCYFEIDKKIYGPYLSCGDVVMSKNKLVFNYQTKNHNYVMNINGKEYVGAKINSDNIDSKISIGNYSLSYLDREKDATNFMRSQLRLLPLGKSIDLCGKALFNVMLDVDNKYYVYTNNKKNGPYAFAGYISCDSDKEWRYIYINQNDVSRFYIKTNNGDFGPFNVKNQDSVIQTALEQWQADSNWFYALVNNSDYRYDAFLNGELIDTNVNDNTLYFSSDVKKRQPVLVTKGTDYYKIFRMK